MKYSTWSRVNAQARLNETPYNASQVSCVSSRLTRKACIVDLPLHGFHTVSSVSRIVKKDYPTLLDARSFQKSPYRQN